MSFAWVASDELDVLREYRTPGDTFIFDLVHAGFVAAQGESRRQFAFASNVRYGVTAQDPQATGKGQPLNTAVRASSMLCPCLRIVER